MPDARVSEDLVVVSASAQIPQVLRRSKLQPVQVGAESKPLGGLVHQLHELVGVVHQVVEGQAGIDARRRQHLEESVVRAVRRIVVAARAKPASAQPGSCRHFGQLISAFHGSGIRAVLPIFPSFRSAARPKRESRTGPGPTGTAASRSPP